MDLRLLTPAQLGDLPEMRPAKQVARPGRSDHRNVRSKLMEGAQIKMIEMRVREQDQIDSWQRGNFKRGRSQPLRPDGEPRQANSDPWEQHRIGDDLDPEKVNQNSRVTEPCQSEAGVIP